MCARFFFAWACVIISARPDFLDCKLFVCNNLRQVSAKQSKCPLTEKLDCKLFCHNELRRLPAKIARKIVRHENRPPNRLAIDATA